MAAVNSFDVHALPMSAAGMALGALQSITDKYIDKLMGPYRVYAEMIIEFLKIHSKEIYENQLRKNLIMHLVAVYDNNQINDEDLVNIIDIMDKIFEQYDKH